MNHETDAPRELDRVVADLRKLVDTYSPIVDEVPAGQVDPALVYRSRRIRDRIFGEHATLFAEPAWDVLLDLYANMRRGNPVSVSDACVAGAVPPTTGLRYVAALVDHGLVNRRADPSDARRCWVELSEKGVALMRNWMAAVPGSHSA